VIIQCIISDSCKSSTGTRVLEYGNKRSTTLKVDRAKPTHKAMSYDNTGIMIPVSAKINSVPRVIGQITIPQSRIPEEIPYNNDLRCGLAQLSTKACGI